MWKGGEYSKGISFFSHKTPKGISFFSHGVPFDGLCVYPLLVYLSWCRGFDIPACRPASGSTGSSSSLCRSGLPVPLDPR